MKLKSFIIAAIALTGFAGNANADTTKLLEADGWTKITTVPTSTDIANNYYVFVDNSNDLMLGVAKGVNQSTKWYSLGVYYQTSVESTSADMNGKTWILESYDGGFAMRNLEYSVFCFQTEWNASYRWDTNDVEAPNGWAKINLAYSNGSWTIENGYYTGNYIGPWNGGNFTNGAECAGNKTASGEVGHFQIYAISRRQFQQNLFDNASTSNPVDLTPWYVTNATFDGGNRTGWSEEGSGGNNNTSYGGGCEIWHRSNFKIYQNLTVPNGKYKVSLQIAGGSAGDGQVYGTSGSTTKTVSSSATAGDNFQSTVLSMIQDRTFGKVLTDEIEVSNGLLQMGMQCSTTDQWIVFDNFKLYCTGVDLSAYQTQLSDLVDECYDFIDSGVVPEACESAISYAITRYNKSYETAKQYSNAIVALTAVLNTYKNDTELQTAYANFNAYKATIVALTDGQSASSDLTTFNNRVNTSTLTVETATAAATITAEIPNLRDAGLTYISSVEGQFDITFLASQAISDWKKKDGSNAGEVTWAVSNRGDLSFAENYEGTAATTGTVLYQTVSNLPAGYYQVGMYAMAAYTPGRDIATEATEGDANRSYAFAGDLNDASSIQRTGIPIPFKSSFDLSELTTLDVNIHLTGTGSTNALTFGVQKDANGSNWHFAQIMSIIYSSTPDLTQLKATRDALVAEATGLKNGSEADYLTSAQKTALQDAIDAGEAADDFDELNTVTLTTLPNAINTAKQQISVVKANRVLMVAALERFESDYNLADGTDYRRVTMSAKAWTDLLTAVNNVTTALDDVSQATNYGTLKDALAAQMDATDTSLRLFKSYRAMVDGTTALNIVGSYAADGNMDTDATEQTAIAALNTAFDTYAEAQTADFSVGAFLGENLDFSAAAGSVINGENSNTIKNVTGWEVNYADADTWAVIQTDQNANNEKLYIRKNWGSSATTLEVFKEKMLPVGKYQLSLDWNSDLNNMDNHSAYVINGTSTSIGENANGKLTYDFEIANSAQPFDLIIGFQKTGTGDAPAQIVVDNVALEYINTKIELANDGSDYNANIATALAHSTFKYDVTLTDRILYKDNSWNTLCLPFSMTKEQVADQLAPAALMELDIESEFSGHKTGVDGTTLYLNFKDAEAIEAGKPYIIKWTSDDNITDPTFSAVTVSNSPAAGIASEDGTVTFKGTYAPVTLTTDGSQLYINSGNTLSWPKSEGFKVNAFRAYFNLGTTAPSRFVLNFGSEATGINAQPLFNSHSAEWYSLDGRRLVGQPTKPGIYMQNNKKIVIK